MIKKILGTMFLVAFVGVPFFVMAQLDNINVITPPDPCAPGGDPVACANSGGNAGGGGSGGTNPSQTSQINVQTAPSVQTSPSVGTSGFSANAKIQNPIKYSTFSEFAAAVTKTAVQVLLPFIVLAFIYSGFLFVRAQGNDTELTKAKNVLWYSMIGAFILLGAWGFAQIIVQTVSTITQ